MVYKAFDNDKYLQMQSSHIRERIAQFGGKLYLEFGGKLYDDNHASRVLPGFQPDSKLRTLRVQRGIDPVSRQYGGQGLPVPVGGHGHPGVPPLWH